MGFMDIFKRKNKMQSLPAARNVTNDRKTAETEDEKDKKKDENKIRVFSQRYGNDTEYSIEMLSDEGNGNIYIGKMYVRTDIENQKGDMNFKEIVNEIKTAVDTMEMARNGEELEKAKKNIKAKLKNLSTKNVQFKLDKNIIAYIDDYSIKEEKIEYEKIDKLVDVVKEMSAPEIIKLGEQLSNRVNTLETIRTPEDAYKHKDSLISYMKEKEDVPENPIIDANSKSIGEGKPLDEATVLSIAKEMEQIKNEDGALYSAYLKLEEKRVLKQIRKVITNYNLSGSNVDMTEVREANQAMRYIKGEIDTTKGGFSPEILEYIIRTIKEEDIGSYTKNYKKSDSKLYDKVKNEMNIKAKDKEEILEFLSARMECLGQLHYKGKDGKTRTGRKTLRKFIEDTNFKDEDDRETKEFLYIIAQIEKEHIKTECVPAVEKYNSSREEKTKETRDSSFKESLHYDIGNRQTRNINNMNKSQNSRIEPEK